MKNFFEKNFQKKCDKKFLATSISALMIINTNYTINALNFDTFKKKTSDISTIVKNELKNHYKIYTGIGISVFLGVTGEKIYTDNIEREVFSSCTTDKLPVFVLTSNLSSQKRKILKKHMKYATKNKINHIIVYDSLVNTNFFDVYTCEFRYLDSINRKSLFKTKIDCRNETFIEKIKESNGDLFMWDLTKEKIEKDTKSEKEKNNYEQLENTLKSNLIKTLNDTIEPLKKELEEMRRNAKEKEKKENNRKLVLEKQISEQNKKLNEESNKLEDERLLNEALAESKEKLAYEESMKKVTAKKTEMMKQAYDDVTNEMLKKYQESLNEKEKMILEQKNSVNNIDSRLLKFTDANINHIWYLNNNNDNIIFNDFEINDEPIYRHSNNKPFKILVKNDDRNNDEIIEDLSKKMKNIDIIVEFTLNNKKQDSIACTLEQLWEHVIKKNKNDEFGNHFEIQKFTPISQVEPMENADNVENNKKEKDKIINAIISSINMNNFERINWEIEDEQTKNMIKKSKDKYIIIPSIDDEGNKSVTITCKKANTNFLRSILGLGSSRQKDENNFKLDDENYDKIFLCLRQNNIFNGEINNSCSVPLLTLKDLKNSGWEIKLNTSE